MTEPYYTDDHCTIYHGDSLDMIDVWLGAHVLVTDPPYGQAFQSSWQGKFQHTQIANDSDEVCRDAALHLWGDGPAIVFGSWRSTIPAATRAVLVWDKGPASGMGDLSIPWKPSFEMIYVLGHGFHGHRSEGVIKGHTIVTWSGRDGSRVHPNEKPLGLLRSLVDKAPPMPIVDPFMGSSTTLRAAKDLGRKAIGIEIDERYCEIAAKRLCQEVIDFGATA